MKTREQLLNESHELLLKFEEQILPEIPGYRESWRYKNLLKTIVDLKNDTFTQMHDIASMYPFVGDELEGEARTMASSLESSLKMYLKLHKK